MISILCSLGYTVTVVFSEKNSCSSIPKNDAIAKKNILGLKLDIMVTSDGKPHIFFMQIKKIAQYTTLIQLVKNY